MAKIAFITTMYTAPWGGSEELWSQAALRLAQSGITVGVNAFSWPEVPKRLLELKQAGCKITFRKRNANFIQRRINQFIGDPDFRWLDSFNPDLVVISQGSSTDGYLWMRECAKRGIQFANIIQSVWPLGPADDAVFQFAEVYKRAIKCFFVSERNLELAKLQFVIPFLNAGIVRNPFKVNYNINLPWPEINQKYKIACVGELEWRKGQDILFEVMSQNKWRERPIEITLYGRGSNCKSFLALSQMFRLENIKYGGHVSDIESIWETHHALILPSRVEGLPLTLVEAMICGRVCIVTDVGGNAEFIEDNVSGFVASAPERKYLDEAMERAWERKNEWKEIGQLAARQIKKYIPSDPVKNFIDKLKGLLKIN